MGFIDQIRKSEKDRILGGVCGGLGEHTPIPTSIWRALFLVLFFFFGTGVLLYIILWICLSAAQDK
ncbi:MAG: PspC domain-containing protein [Candidatus Sumerlaeota bacterium]|nr:PspC domain-containing protein [Candidatus Sumerlaeota bacterium]